MTAAAFRLDVEQFMGWPWTETEREQVRAWMTANGIDPDHTAAITLGEGYIEAEHYLPISGDVVRIVTKRYPVATLPPVWHDPQNPTTRNTRPLEATKTPPGDHRHPQTRQKGTQ